MADSLEKLLILQESDRRKMQLEREQRDIPRRKEEIGSSLQKHQLAVDSAKEAIQQSMLKLKELEGDSEAFNQRLRKYKEQQLSVKNNDEYRALEREISSTKRDIGKFEERQLSVMEEVESLKGVAAERETEMAESSKLVDDELATMNERLEAIEGEIESYAGQRPGTIEGIDEQWLVRYERILNHLGDFALVSVENGTCTGCHMTVPPQLVHNARKRDSLTTCSYCGRILFMA